MITRLAWRHDLSRPLLIALVLVSITQGVSGAAAQAVTVAANQPNVVSFWNDIANKTVLAPSSVNTTPEEQRPTFIFDVASVHVAIYDAVVAIEGRYKPFAIKPQAPAAGASSEAAVSAAAHGVLKALFPNLAAQYQPVYEQRLAAIPDGQAKTLGMALGSEVAAAVVRLRANDGRSVALAPYESRTDAGRFRVANPNPVFRHFPAIRPFALDRMDQLRPAPPPALDSAAYAAAFDETRSLGGAVSARRTQEQLEVARFHTEPPPTAITRNLGRFASSTFTWDSTVTGTTRSYAGVEAFSAEAGIARIHGGMHFTHAVAAGEELGKRVAEWVAARHFGRQR